MKNSTPISEVPILQVFQMGGAGATPTGQRKPNENTLDNNNESKNMISRPQSRTTAYLNKSSLSALLLFLGLAVQLTAAQTTDPRDDASPWGMSSSAEWFGAYPQFNPLLKDAGVRWLRYFPGWFSVEPKQGEFHWDSTDKLMVNARENNLHISGLFVFFPPWAAADGKNPRACPVKDITYWSEYVRQSVTRYKGDIKYWEIWNEFNGGGFAISKDKPKDYADMTVAAYKAAKAVDPTTMIGMSCANFDLNFFDKAIKAGAAGHFDFLAVHPYENMGEATKEGGEPVFLSMAGSLRKMLSDNKQNASMPLWITEVGFQAPVKPDAVKDALQADAIVKCYVMAIAQGFAKIEWFEARGPQYGKGTDHGIIRADWTLRPSYTALKNMIALLGAEPQYVGWLKVGGEGYGFVFKVKHSYVMASWAARNEGMEVQFTGDVRLMDQTGKIEPLAAGEKSRFSRMATFVLELPIALVKKAMENKAKPFPWGGDFTGKETVRCLLGSNAENGLSLTTPESVTIVNALDHTYAKTLTDKGKLPHHFSFRVHPSFVSDSPREFEITLVAMRAEPSKSAQTRIYFYESVNGYKPTGEPWVIPEGDAWVEHSWRVTDANFVGQWGYNFCFEVQSVNPFLIKEVRVKRLSPRASN